MSASDLGPPPRIGAAALARYGARFSSVSMTEIGMELDLWFDTVSMAQDKVIFHRPLLV